MNIEAQIKEFTLGLSADEVVFLIKGVVQMPLEAIHIIEGATRADAILELLKDGWTAIPF